MNSGSEGTDRYAGIPSERSFGGLFSFVFAVLAAYSAYRGRSFALVMPLSILSVLLFVVTLSKPSLLAPLNRIWFSMGMWLGNVVRPIALGGIFYLLITPVALTMRMAGRDELHMKKRNVTSYWIKKQHYGSSRDSFNNQF